MVHPTSQSSSRLAPTSKSSSTSDLVKTTQDKNQHSKKEDSTYFPSATGTNGIKPNEESSKLESLCDIAKYLSSIEQNISKLPKDCQQSVDQITNIIKEVSTEIGCFSNTYSTLPTDNDIIPQSQDAIQALFEITDSLLFIILHVFAMEKLTKSAFNPLIQSLEKVNVLLQRIHNTKNTLDDHPLNQFSRAGKMLVDIHNKQKYQLLFAKIKQREERNTPSDNDNLKNYYDIIYEIAELSFFSNYQLSLSYSESNNQSIENSINLYNITIYRNIIQPIEENMDENEFIDLRLTRPHISIFKHQCLISLVTQMLEQWRILNEKVHTGVITIDRKNCNTILECRKSFDKNTVLLLNILDKHVHNRLNLPYIPLFMNETHSLENLGKFLDRIKLKTTKFIEQYENLPENNQISPNTPLVEKLKYITEKLYNLAQGKDDTNTFDKVQDLIIEFMDTYNEFGNKEALKNQSVISGVFAVAHNLLFIIFDLNYFEPQIISKNNYNFLMGILPQLEYDALTNILTEVQFIGSNKPKELAFSNLVTQLNTYYKRNLSPATEVTHLKFKVADNQHKYYESLTLFQNLNTLVLKKFPQETFVYIDISGYYTPENIEAWQTCVNYMINIMEFVNNNLLNSLINLDSSEILSLSVYKKLLIFVRTPLVQNTLANLTNIRIEMNQKKLLTKLLIRLISALNSKLSTDLNTNSDDLIITNNPYENNNVINLLEKTEQKFKRILENKYGKDKNVYDVKGSSYTNNLEKKLSFLVSKKEKEIDRISDQIRKISILIEKPDLFPSDSFCEFLANKPTKDGYPYRRVALCILLALLDKKSKELSPQNKANLLNEFKTLYDNNKNKNLISEIILNLGYAGSGSLEIKIPQQTYLGIQIPKNNSIKIGGNSHNLSVTTSQTTTTPNSVLEEFYNEL